MAEITSENHLEFNNTDGGLFLSYVNTNGANSRLIPVPQTQENVNKTMRILVGSLEAMLAWNGKDGDGNDLPPNTQPDVAGYSGDKSSYTDAITLGNTYITNNS